VGLTERLLRTATARPPYLLVAVPGQSRLRCLVERALRERGWPQAASAAGACVLVVAGSAPDDLEAAVGEVWRQMPLPRARVDVGTDADPDGVLDGSVARLRDVHAQRAGRAEDQRARAEQEEEQPEHDDESGGGTDHGGMDHGGMDHGSGGGTDHDMGDVGDMKMPAGLPMADTAPDRDGLELDQLHVPLGPVLPHWPAGLVLRLTLQGEVVQEADVDVLGRPRHDAPGLPPAAARLDAVAGLLGVLGAEDLAVAAARLRDDLLAGDPPATVRPHLDRLARRLHRSRLLGRLTAGHARLAGEDAEQRWHRWLDEARAALDGEAPGPGPEGPDVLAALPDLVRGLDVADVRLVVASLDVPTGTALRRPVAVV
jgi:hypothetical protein